MGYIFKGINGICRYKDVIISTLIYWNCLNLSDLYIILTNFLNKNYFGKGVTAGRRQEG